MKIKTNFFLLSCLYFFNLSAQTSPVDSNFQYIATPNLSLTIGDTLKIKCKNIIDNIKVISPEGNDLYQWDLDENIFRLWSTSKNNQAFNVITNFNYENFISDTFRVFIHPNITTEYKLLNDEITLRKESAQSILFNKAEYNKEDKFLFITGKTIIFDHNSTFQQHINEFNFAIGDPRAKPPLKNVEIHAEKIIINERVWFPQCIVKIYAKIIEFSDNGYLDVSPVPLECVTDGQPCNPASELEGGKNNYNEINGRDAGQITCLVKEMYANKKNRFILTGGEGGIGYTTNKKVDGESCTLPDFPKLSWIGNPCGNPFTQQNLRKQFARDLEAKGMGYKDIACIQRRPYGLGKYGEYSVLEYYRRSPNTNQCKCEITSGNDRTCKDGGIGGNGGLLTVELTDVSNNRAFLLAPADVSGGPGGKIGKVYIGGIKGLPENYVIAYLTVVDGLCSQTGYLYDKIKLGHTTDGRDCQPQTGQKGSNGKIDFSLLSNEDNFISPFWLHQSIAYAEDLYLHRYYDEAFELFSEYKVFINSAIQHPVSEEWKVLLRQQNFKVELY